MGQPDGEHSERNGERSGQKGEQHDEQQDENDGINGYCLSEALAEMFTNPGFLEKGH
jgi:hypothetical protein